jgi:hypothetical protein
MSEIDWKGESVIDALMSCLITILLLFLIVVHHS